MIKKLISVSIQIILLLGFFSACTPSNPSTTPTVSLEIIDLQMTQKLEHWMPKINQCADTIQGLGIYTDVLTDETLNIQDADLVLRLGQREPKDPFVAVMGKEEIVIVSGSKIPVNELSVETIKDIFTGKISNWGDVTEVRQQEIEFKEPVTVLTYPEGDFIRQLFINSYLNQESIHSQSLVFSTTNALSHLLEEYPYAIGYVLKNHKPESSKIVDVNGSENLFTEYLVLAISAQEPQGKLKQLLLCLQNSP